jgi:hypothetical protein
VPYGYQNPWGKKQFEGLFTLKCSNLVGVTGVSRNLAASELEAGEASRRLLRLRSGLSSGSEATWASSNCPPSASLLLLTSGSEDGLRRETTVGFLKETRGCKTVQKSSHIKKNQPYLKNVKTRNYFKCTLFENPRDHQLFQEAIQSSRDKVTYSILP